MAFFLYILTSLPVDISGYLLVLVAWNVILTLAFKLSFCFVASLRVILIAECTILSLYVNKISRSKSIYWMFSLRFVSSALTRLYNISLYVLIPRSEKYGCPRVL